MRGYRKVSAELNTRRLWEGGAEAFRLCAVRKFRELAEKDPEMLVAARIVEQVRMG